MQGIDKITARILEDARREGDAVLEGARRAAGETGRAYAARAGAEAGEILEKARRGAEERRERLMGVAALEARKMALATKQEMLDAAFRKAGEALAALPEEQMVPFLARLAARASRTGAEQLVLSPGDHARFGKKVLAAANDLLRQAGKAGGLTLSASPRTLSGGGLVLSDGDVEVNCTFAALVREQRDAFAAGAAAILFGG